jgi:putative Mg2+ transporter-C (MgtC) family protein
VIGPGEGELIGRISLAVGLGAAVGLERELADKAAGLRTLALVALASASFSVAGYAVLQLPDATQLRPDPTRIAAQVVSGIGFLGAGIIFVAAGQRVRGLTTAADLWMVAAIGMLCGLGMLWVAMSAAGLTIFVVAGMRPVEKVLADRRKRSGRNDFGQPEEPEHPAPAP